MTKDQNDSKKEFEDLYKKYHKKLYSTAFYLCLNHFDAEDVLQQSVVDAFSNFTNLRNKEFFYTWITRILINNRNKLYKRKSKISIVELTDNLIYEEKYDDFIKSIVETLDEKHRSVFILKYVEDLPIKEIAQVLKIPQGTVKSRLSRTISKIKKELAKEV